LWLSCTLGKKTNFGYEPRSDLRHSVISSDIKEYVGRSFSKLQNGYVKEINAVRADLVSTQQCIEEFNVQQERVFDHMRSGIIDEVIQAIDEHQIRKINNPEIGNIRLETTSKLSQLDQDLKIHLYDLQRESSADMVSLFKQLESPIISIRTSRHL